jgi:hypothetical protein
MANFNIKWSNLYCSSNLSLFFLASVFWVIYVMLRYYAFFSGHIMENKKIYSLSMLCQGSAKGCINLRAIFPCSRALGELFVQYCIRIQKRYTSWGRKVGGGERTSNEVWKGS